MNHRYKVIISNKNIYKEIDLNEADDEIKLGTTSESDIRLRKEFFFSTIEIVFSRVNGKWQFYAADNIYFTYGDSRKLFTVKPKHGETFSVKYQDYDNEIFDITFLIDFDYKLKKYDMELNLREYGKIQVGGKNGNIRYIDSYLGNDYFVITNSRGKYIVKDANTKYGVFINGMRIESQQELKDFDFISIVGFSFYFKNEKLYTSSEDINQIEGIEIVKNENYTTHFSHPKFNRSTRIQYVIPSDSLEIQQAVSKPSKPKKNLVMTLIPSLVMLGMTIVLRGIIGNGGVFVIYSAVSMSLGAAMSIVAYIKDGKEYKKEWKNRIEQYNEYIQKKEIEIKESRANEVRVRNLIFESLEDDISEVNQFGKRLFEKRLDDSDFLQIYIGKGKIESSNQVEFNKLEFVDTEDPLATIPEEISNKYRYIENAPIISNVKTANGVGIVGDYDELIDILKNITLDISIRHFYNEVKLVYLLTDQYYNNLQWIRWLHNVENHRLDIRNIVSDEESMNIILEDLYMILSTRENLRKESKEYKFENHYVVFVTDASKISTHPVSKYLGNCETLGFTFIFLEKYEENLPLGCGEIIRIKDSENGEIVNSQNGDFTSKFKYTKISDGLAEKIALRLGSVLVDEVSLEGELTKNITMYELLDILTVEDMNLDERWNNSIVYKSLAAPLGVKKKGEIIYLDISDKAGAHGPHGLVAGTTGSGKSEVLQTYILSMATLYHPYEVGFVIIDFKGGGMANQFKELPHLIGTITNIDGREINRSLLSIKAELVKRQEWFSENGVNHINDYIKLYKSGKVNRPMPHLIMIVDEFAELKQEYPDFMKELISAARIGRTLGVHLILATQKPAGVVDAQIWSNSKFKLCLKVQTKEDSNEVLKTPMAAEIIEPGRAYFQVGNNEIFELFQSAYSGANIPEGNENDEKIFSIYEKNMWGKKKLVYTNKKVTSDNNSVSQLQAIVDYVREYCEIKKIKRLPGICLPSLQDKITTDELDYIIDNTNKIEIPIGYYDDPEQQEQGMVELDISKENIYIVASAQMGKTVLLQTMIYGLMRRYTPQDVNIYLIDCGSMVLKIFESSKYVGGVVLSNEEEKCKNLFKLLNGMIVERKKILSNKGIGNYSSYREAGYTDMPLAVVMIDNMAAFKEYFPDQADDIDSLSLFQCYRVCVRVFLKSKVRNSIALAVIYELCCINADICLDNGVSFRKCRDHKNVITITVWVETHISLICFIYVLVYKDSSVCFAYCLDMCRIIVFRADKASLYHVICRRIADRFCCIAVRIGIIILNLDICYRLFVFIIDKAALVNIALVTFFKNKVECSILVEHLTAYRCNCAFGGILNGKNL